MMRASDFINEASIIDRLKGAFRKKPAAGTPNRIEPRLDNTVATPTAPAQQVRRPNVGNSAFNQMATQLTNRPETLSTGSAATRQMANQLTKRKGMKVKKTDPRTAVGMKATGGSPEYKAAQAAIANKPLPTTPPPPQIPPPPPEPAAPEAQQQVHPASSYADIKADIDRKTYEKTISNAIVSKIQSMTNPDLLNGIRIALDAKLKSGAK